MLDSTHTISSDWTVLKAMGCVYGIMELNFIADSNTCSLGVYPTRYVAFSPPSAVDYYYYQYFSWKITSFPMLIDLSMLCSNVIVLTKS